MSNVIFYRCEICGNIVALIKNGGGELVCCGQPMTKLEPNTTDGAREKHVPVISKGDGKIKVAVGAVLHPMLQEHHIEWIAVDNGERMDIVHLKPGMEPIAEFGNAIIGAAYAYCNLHGLWTAEIING
jgi:superoxide reductase